MSEIYDIYVGTPCHCEDVNLAHAQKGCVLQDIYTFMSVTDLACSVSGKGMSLYGDICLSCQSVKLPLKTGRINWVCKGVALGETSISLQFTTDKNYSKRSLVYFSKIGILHTSHKAFAHVKDRALSKKDRPQCIEAFAKNTSNNIFGGIFVIYLDKEGLIYAKNAQIKVSDMENAQSTPQKP